MLPKYTLINPFVNIRISFYLLLQLYVSQMYDLATPMDFYEMLISRCDGYLKEVHNSESRNRIFLPL